MLTEIFDMSDIPSSYSLLSSFVHSYKKDEVTITIHSYEFKEENKGEVTRKRNSGVHIFFFTLGNFCQQHVIHIPCLKMKTNQLAIPCLLLYSFLDMKA